MREFIILISPYLWSLKNEIIRLRWRFLKKVFFYTITGTVLIILFTGLLNAGISELQRISKELTEIILIKAYAIIFLIIFFIQILNGFIISLRTFYNSSELELLVVSPVNRTSFFSSRLLITHLKTSWMLLVFGLPLIISPGIIHHAKPYYYILTPPLLLLFSGIAVNVGVITASILSSAIHVMRLKRFLMTGGIISIALLITLFRIFRPERFVNPEFFANLTIFIAEIKAPFFILLPNRWLGESIFRILNKTTGIDLILFISIIILTSYLTIIIAVLALKRFHYRGWEIINKGEGMVWRRQRILKRLESIRPVLFKDESLALIKKELILQIRNPENIQNFIILLSLIVIYIFSISALPLNWVEYGLALRYIVAFLNLGLIMIILTSITSRIAYPSIISEKEHYWLLKTSPIKPLKYITSKFLIYLLPGVLIGLFLVTITSLMIGLEIPFILIKVITIAAITPSIISMAIYYGISGGKEASKISTPYLLSSTFLILIILGIEVIPTFLYFLKEKMVAEFSQKGILMIMGSIILVLTINLGITNLSIRRAIKRFDYMD